MRICWSSHATRASPATSPWVPRPILGLLVALWASRLCAAAAVGAVLCRCCAVASSPRFEVDWSALAGCKSRRALLLQKMGSYGYRSYFY